MRKPFAFCSFANVPNTLHITVYRDKYHYSANLRCSSCVNFSSNSSSSNSSNSSRSGGGGNSS